MPPTPQTLRDFWYLAASKFAAAAADPSPFLENGRLIRDVFGDLPARGIRVGDNDAVLVQQYYEDRCESQEKLSWPDEDHSLSLIPRE